MAMATGHKVIAFLLRSLFARQAEREISHGRHCEPVGTGVQTNSIVFGEEEEDLGSLFARASSMGPFLGLPRNVRLDDNFSAILRRSGCFQPSDRLAGWDSHPLEIANCHGTLSF